MTTKILTVRVPAPLYSSLSQQAGELGMPVAAHVRGLLERQNDAQQLQALRAELLQKLDRLVVTSQPAAAQPNGLEVLLLCRAIAAQMNPQLVAQVRAKLALPQQ